MLTWFSVACLVVKPASVVVGASSVGMGQSKLWFVPRVWVVSVPPATCLVTGVLPKGLLALRISVVLLWSRGRLFKSRLYLFGVSIGC